MAASTDLGTLLIATESGLYISRDNTVSFRIKTVDDGLGSNVCRDVAAEGSNVYVATGNGVSISTDNAESFTNYTFESTAGQIPSNSCRKVKAWSGKIVVTTDHGAAVSMDNGRTWTRMRFEEGKVPSNDCRDCYIRGAIWVITTSQGLIVSTDDTKTWVTQLSTKDCRDIALSPIGYFLVAASDGVYRANATLTAFLGPLSTGIGTGESIKSIRTDDAGVLFLVTTANLYTSKDNGDSFQKEVITVDGTVVNPVLSDVFVRRDVVIDVTKIGKGNLVNTKTWNQHFVAYDADVRQVTNTLGIKFYLKARTPLWADAVIKVNGASVPYYKRMVYTNGYFSTSIPVLAGQTFDVKFRYENGGISS